MQRILSTLIAFGLCVVSARAVTVWDEAFDGDLTATIVADVASTATPLTLGIGVNSVKGTMGRDEPGDPLDLDFFTFTLTAGQALTSINVIQFDPLGYSFYAIAGGTSIHTTNPANHLSNILVSGLGEILDDLDAGSYNGGLGLTAPLGPGTYTVWFQELASVVAYQMDYTVVAVPEAATACTGLALGLVAAGNALRRRRLSR